MKDIIAAISTAWGESGIAVIRLSGDGSRDLVSRIFRGGTELSRTPPRFMRHGFIVDEQGVDLDEVLAVWFREPFSYTGEEAAEIQCHGGTVAARRCLDLCLSSGARTALPGEFTQRAFLNGRLDLVQAESVLGIIRSRSDRSLQAATKCLRGSFSRQVTEIHDRMLEVSALGEASLDHPDEDIPLVDPVLLAGKISEISDTIRLLLSTARTGRFLREGIRVALSGKPNVGKSSLMNALLQESRSIVTSMPGTTRDIIEEVVTHNGVPLRLVDTAGLRTPRDEAEEEGLKRALEAIREADIRVWVIDGSVPLSEDDREFAENHRDSCCVVAINKSDLPLVVSERSVEEIFPGTPVRVISAFCGQGIEELKDQIVLEVTGRSTVDEDLNTTERQVDELRKTMDLTGSAMDALSSGAGLDAALELMRDARECIARILGISTDRSLMESIFSNFCIGK